MQVFWMVFVATAFGQSEPAAAAEDDAAAEDEEEAGPLAIPIDEAPPATRSPQGASHRSQTDSGRPLALPPDASGRPRLPGPPEPTSPQLARAQRTYARKALSVQPITELSVRSATVGTAWGPGWGWGPYWGGWYSMPMVDARHGWAVFEGEHRLDVPTALDKLGETPLRVDLERRIRRARTASTAWTAVGVAGLVGGLVGVIGLDQSRTYDEARAWSTVATAGSLAGIGGLVVGSFPSSKARRMAVDPSWTIAREDAEDRADAANAALAAELGLEDHQVDGRP